MRKMVKLCKECNAIRVPVDGDDDDYVDSMPKVVKFVIYRNIVYLLQYFLGSMSMSTSDLLILKSMLNHDLSLSLLRQQFNVVFCSI